MIFVLLAFFKIILFIWLIFKIKISASLLISQVYIIINYLFYRNLELHYDIFSN